MTYAGILERWTHQRRRRAAAGFTFVELLSTCPTGWGLTPDNSVAWLDRNMVPFFPMEVFREPGKMPVQATPYHPDLKVRDDAKKEG